MFGARGEAEQPTGEAWDRSGHGYWCCGRGRQPCIMRQAAGRVIEGPARRGQDEMRPCGPRGRERSTALCDQPLLSSRDSVA